MPWLSVIALRHSALVVEKGESLKVWTILLAILTFSLSLMGTFLVRSGVLSSVHSFAVDPRRGVFILAIMVLFVGGGLTLFALRAAELKQGGLFAPISREGSLVLNNVLLTAACGTVLVGTLYPLALEGLTGTKISVGAPYFDATFGPIMVPLLLALPFGPFLAWKRGDLLGAAQRLMAATRWPACSASTPPPWPPSSRSPPPRRSTGAGRGWRRSASRLAPTCSSEPLPSFCPGSPQAVTRWKRFAAGPGTCPAPRGARRSPTRAWD
jgi:cytochrome c biogenesis factor